ncbi:MAG: trigger factor [Candidatus Manganitrophaceae bacterium]
MKVQVEEVSSVKKTLKIEIPQEVVSGEFTLAYADLKKKATLPGFRPGKIPQGLLEKKFGPSVEEEIVRKLLPDYYQKAIKETGLSPVELPTIEKVELKKGEPLLFTATVEIRPTIGLSNYTGIPVPRKKIRVTEEEVEEALKRLQDQQGHLEAVPEDHTIKTSDYAIIDFEGTLDGRPVEKGSATAYTLQVGSKNFPAEFEAALLGKKKGDQTEVDVPYAADFPNKQIAGKTLHFTIAVKEIKTKVLPPLDDDLAKDVGLSNLQELKEKIWTNFLDQRKAQEEHDQKNLIVKKLVEMHPFDVPESMVDREIHGMIDRFQGNLPQKVDHESLHKEYESIAKERVKGTLILHEIANVEKIEPTEQEIDQEIGRLAERAGVSPAEAKRLIDQQEGSMEGLKARLREEKTLNRVYSLAHFEDKGESA